MMKIKLFWPSTNYFFNQYKILGNKKQIRADRKKIEREPQKALWFEINKQEFKELTNEIYNNQDNKGFKITINKRTYDWKNAKTIWTKITTSKIFKNVAKKLYEELIQKDIDALTRQKNNSINKHNILQILDNVGAIFTAKTYLHYRRVSNETEFEKSIAERAKLRREKIAEIEGEEKNKL